MLYRKRSRDWQGSQDSHYWCMRRLCNACGPEGIPRKATCQLASEVKVFGVALVPRRHFFGDCKVIQGVGLRKQDRQRSGRQLLAPKPDWSRWQQPPFPTYHAVFPTFYKLLTRLMRERDFSAYSRHEDVQSIRSKRRGIGCKSCFSLAGLAIGTVSLQRLCRAR